MPAPTPSPRLLDVSGINPATKRPWFGTREFIWNGMRLAAQWVNHQLAENPATDGVGTCLHWTADRRRTIWNDYMVNAVADDAGNAFLVKAVAWNQRQAHLWKRNSMIDGWTICGNPEVDGWQPIVAQVDLIAQYNAEYCAWKRINPRGTIVVPEVACNKQATEAWFTGRKVMVPACFDHAGYAKKDGYGPHRYDARAKAVLTPGPKSKLDVQLIYDRYMERTLAVYDALKAGSRNFEFEASFAR